MASFSVCCGNKACDANCRCCISKITCACDCNDIGSPDKDFNWDKLQWAIDYIKVRQVPSALITGRGEPCLHQKHLLDIAAELRQRKLHVEVQTNGKALSTWSYDSINELKRYCGNVAISVFSLDPRENNEIMRFNNGSYDICRLVNYLNAFGITVRLVYMLYFENHKSSYQEKKDSAWFLSRIKIARNMGVKQITFRSVGIPESENQCPQIEWAESHGDRNDYTHIIRNIANKRLWDMSWGGQVYDVDGMSVCIESGPEGCLTERVEKPRSFIFDGQNLRYSWQYEGAIIF